jgi:hypothetical protein
MVPVSWSNDMVAFFMTGAHGGTEEYNGAAQSYGTLCIGNAEHNHIYQRLAQQRNRF